MPTSRLEQRSTHPLVHRFAGTFKLVYYLKHFGGGATPPRLQTPTLNVQSAFTSTDFDGGGGGGGGLGGVGGGGSSSSSSSSSNEQDTGVWKYDDVEGVDDVEDGEEVDDVDDNDDDVDNDDDLDAKLAEKMWHSSPPNFFFIIVQVLLAMPLPPYKFQYMLIGGGNYVINSHPPP